MHGPEAATAADRPARGIENAIQRLNSLNQMAGNIEHRLGQAAERLVIGLAPEKPLGGNIGSGIPGADQAPELSQLVNGIDQLEHRLQLILDHTNTLEGV